MSSSVHGVLKRFVADKRGNIAVTFAIAVMPILAGVGCAVDYSRAAAMRSKLQSAIDSASVASISRNSPAYVAAGNMTSDGDITKGENDAKKVFNGNMANTTGYTLVSLTTDVKKAGNELTSTVTFNVTVDNTFMGVMGQPKMTLTGKSVAKSSLPNYIDFYLLLDNSSSMGVGATPADVAKMVANTSDQCAFACHDNSDANNYYNLAKRLGVTMRIDTLRLATQQLMDTATDTRTFSDQFRMAIYDFGASITTSSLRQLFALSSSLSSAKSAANNIDLMTINYQGELNDMGTSFSAIFPTLNLAITNPGNGTSGSPLKYLFFVSDGVADENNPACLKPTTDGKRCQSPINPALCKTLKDRGIKVAVLYTTYLALPTNGWYNSWISPFNPGPYGPSTNSQIATNMQACASPGFYFEVSPTQGISDAMTALFRKAVSDARLAS